MDSDEPRKSEFGRIIHSSVPNRIIFPDKESDFTSMDDSAFIDLKLDLSSESKSDFPVGTRLSNGSDNGRVGLDLSRFNMAVWQLL
ncbi:hypothetical protein CQW23_09074 [Capsicum baccatum]|uniref:Uncharacterized protein n=1 Tax=Capsicum baccatum TaxID=33114 RepID=A0A2G2XAS6_CAPBA|nr:hypothetical protein CQW23_09074 [Capsicum baccatum]